MVRAVRADSAGGLNPQDAVVDHRIPMVVIRGTANGLDGNTIFGQRNQAGSRRIVLDARQQAFRNATIRVSREVGAVITNGQRRDGAHRGVGNHAAAVIIARLLAGAVQIQNAVVHDDLSRRTENGRRVPQRPGTFELDGGGITDPNKPGERVGAGQDQHAGRGAALRIDIHLVARSIIGTVDDGPTVHDLAGKLSRFAVTRVFQYAASVRASVDDRPPAGGLRLLLVVVVGIRVIGAAGQV